MGEAREFNLGCGFTVPMITLDGQTAGFYLASERADVRPKVRRQLQLIAMHAFARDLWTRPRISDAKSEGSESLPELILAPRGSQRV
jgi:hypothetical protein